MLLLASFLTCSWFSLFAAVLHLWIVPGLHPWLFFMPVILVPTELSVLGGWAILGWLSLNHFTHSRWVHSLPLYSSGSPSQFIYLFFNVPHSSLSSVATTATTATSQNGKSLMCYFFYYDQSFWLPVSLWFLLPSSIKFQWVPFVTHLAEEQSSHFISLGLRTCWGLSFF